MNIIDFWPDGPLNYNTSEIWLELLERRKATYTGFAQIERNKGFLEPSCSVNTSRGQEMMRILFFRVLEEAVESFDSVDPSHRKEEAIDAINYLLAAALLDQNLYYDRELAITLRAEVDYRSTWENFWMSWEENDLLGLTKYLAGVTDKFRNRAWMEQAQDIYFAGATELKDTITTCFAILLSAFESFDEFVRFFIAKDEVLKFRLRSQY